MESAAPSLPQLVKQVLGDTYQLEGEIGRGGMGVVYRAKDTRLQRRVAIKVLPPELALSRDIRERFIREAQTAAKLSHPHIVPIHDVGEGEGIVYFVMGLIEGESLAARLQRRGKLAPEEGRRIICETADALSAAHALSIIHRDIKPDNILLEGPRARVMVTDFGIAKALSDPSGHTLTSVGMAIGTPSFMSPEQAAGEREVDGRSDLYSLGVVAYRMLAGELPFTAPTVAGILMKQLTEIALPLHQRFPEISQDLSLAVARCMEKDPANRWPTAEGLRRALESRTVTGYQPTGLRHPAARSRVGNRPANFGVSPERRATSQRTLPTANRPVTPRDRVAVPAGRSRMNSAPAGSSSRHAIRSREATKLGELRNQGKRLPDTGEPLVILRARAQFVRWLAVSGGTFLLNLATGLSAPWFLFVVGGMSIGVFKSYSDLWQAGYSWRDMLNRPAAPDSITQTGTARTPGGYGEPRVAELGRYHEKVHNLWVDRQAIRNLWDRLSAADQELLPILIQTVDDLYRRGLQLGQTLHSMDELRQDDTVESQRRLEELRSRPEDSERDQQISLLERAIQAQHEIQSQRNRCLDRLESCSLMMQTLRLDLLRIRDRGLGAVMSGLNEATQQARAVSRDVDIALTAAAEIKDL